VLHVAPDILPPGRVKLEQVWVDDQEYSGFDADQLTVKLPTTTQRVHVKARLVPVAK
jgi:hypothetical protein